MTHRLVWLLCALCLGLVHCALDTPQPINGAEPGIDMAVADQGQPPSVVDPPTPPQPPWPGDLMGRACTADADCQGASGASCAKLLGDDVPGICTMTGCEGTACPQGSQCQTIGDRSVCLPVAQGFCATQCAAPLECALKLECFEKGCCGTGPCPAVCAELSFSDCEMNARCSSSCCVLER